LGNGAEEDSGQQVLKSGLKPGYRAPKKPIQNPDSQTHSDDRVPAMFAQRLTKLGLLVALCVPLAGAVGCGKENEVKTANVKPKDMPAGAEWQGVYYSTLYGYLHLQVDGNSARGAWRTTAGDAFGEMHGTVEGNLLKYEWKERKIGAVGANAERHGKGYFVYQPIVEGESDKIAGEWGLNEDEAGEKWEAVKQKNMQPNPDSVKPDEFEGRVNAGGWDDSEGGESEGGEEKKPDDSPSAPE
jgi:hypothetical protein